MKGGAHLIDANVLPFHESIGHVLKDAVTGFWQNPHGGVAQIEKENVEIPVEFGHGCSNTLASPYQF